MKIDTLNWKQISLHYDTKKFKLINRHAVTKAKFNLGDFELNKIQIAGHMDSSHVNSSNIPCIISSVVINDWRKKVIRNLNFSHGQDYLLDSNPDEIVLINYPDLNYVRKN